MKKSTLLIASIIIGNGLFAQETQSNPNGDVIQGIFNGISKPLSDLFETEPYDDNLQPYELKESADRTHRKPQIFVYTAEKDGPAYSTEKSSIQTQMGNRAPVTILTEWAGQNGGGYPPDPSGAAGLNHYVQSVNATPFKVFNKTTGAQMGSIRQIGSLWSPAVGNMGDPIIMYDRYADRWFVSQFGQSGGTNWIYIAISTTPDPTGTYYTYSFSHSQFPDYLKFSIWQDGYYMSSNMSTDRIFCFERNKMLVGDATAKAVSQTFSTGTVSGFFCPLVADADGGLPPGGTPCPFFWYTENSWGGGSVDGIKYCKATVNWVPATPTLTITAATQITTAAHDGTYNASWNDIDQPGTTAKLDGIGGVPTYRAQWRAWTGYNSLLLNWGVKTGVGTQRSIKWVELRETPAGSGTWAVYQQGVYAPDTKSRWVGSIAMDDNGSIALCYARASSATGDFASLGFTGRLATDPLGTMTFAETMVEMGTAAQTSNNRFGDYSQTSLDPDGLTFWHTGEFLQSGPRTRIYSFRLPLTPTGVEESGNQINNIVAFQSNSTLNVTAKDLAVDGELVVDLFDITGKQIDGKQIVVNGQTFETSFNTSNLSAGTYLVRVGKMNTAFQKVVKVIIK